MAYMISGQMLSLIGWGVIVFFIGLGFLIGFFRGMKKSLYFTIIFIAIVLCAWFLSKPIAKSVYNGSTLWNMTGSYIPDMGVDTTEITSYSEFSKQVISVKLNEEMSETATVGETLLANEEAMELIDGIVIMVLRIVMLIVLLIGLRIVFYIIGGIIWLFFLRPAKELSDGTTYKKRRVIGGLVGSFKGLISAMIFLIPISSLIGVVAMIEIPEESSASVKMLELDTADDEMRDVIEMCKEFDSGSIAKMYDILSFGAEKGFDDAIVDSLLTINVEDKEKIVLREEMINLLQLYNAVEETIGVENIDKYDFSASINNPEMVELIKELSNTLGDSNFVTYLLTVADDECLAFIKQKLVENDEDYALLFEEISFGDKDSEWWSSQIKNIGEIYEAMTLLKIDVEAALDGKYNEAFMNVRKDAYDDFVDKLFEEELIPMMAEGLLKFGITKLPADFIENSSNVIDTYDSVSPEIKDEMKQLANLMNIILDDVDVTSSNIDLSDMKVSTFERIVNAEIMKNSVLAEKIIGDYLAKTLVDIEYNGSSIGVVKSDFEGTFSWQNELASLVSVMKDVFGSNYSIMQFQDLNDSSLTVGQMTKLLKNSKTMNSIIVCKIAESLAPQVMKSVFGDDLNFTGVTWKNEFYSLGCMLEEIYDSTDTLSSLAGFDVQNMSLRKIDSLIKNDYVWQSKVLNIILNKEVIEYVDSIDLGSGAINASDGLVISNIVWKNEFTGMLNICLSLSNQVGDARYNEKISIFSTGFSGDVVKVESINAIADTINEQQDGVYKAILINNVAEAIMDKNIGTERSSARIETRVLTEVGDVLDNTEGYGTINLSQIGNTMSNSMTKGKMVELLDTIEENIAESDYLKVLIKGNFTLSSRTLDPDGNWTDAKWQDEIHCTKLVVDELTDSDDDLMVIDNVKTTLSTAMPINLLVVLKTKEGTNVHTVTGRSDILQGLIIDSLGTMVPSDSNTWSADDWDNEMDGLVSVAVTLQNAEGNLDVNALKTLSSISKDTLDAMMYKTATTHTNVTKSHVLRKVIADNIGGHLNTNMNNTDENIGSTWADDDKWDREIIAICNVMETMLNAETNTISFSEMSMDSNTEIKSETLDALEEGIPQSEALQNMFYSIVTDGTENFPKPPAYTYEGRNTWYNECYVWWGREVNSIVSILESQVSDGKVQANKIINLGTVNASLLDALIYKGTNENTNVGKSLIIQYKLAPNIENFVNSVNTSGTYKNPITNLDGPYVIVNWDSERWDAEITSIANILKISIFTGYDAEGNPVYDYSADINFNSISMDLETEGELATDKNKLLFQLVSENIDGATAIQYSLVPIFDGMKDLNYLPYKEVADWNNSDWIRETEAMNNVADALIDANNMNLNYSSIDINEMNGEEYRTQVLTLAENSPKSYLLQSMLSATLVTAGINRYSNAYESGNNFIDDIRNIEITGSQNDDWDVMMDVISSKIDLFVSIGGDITLEIEGPSTYCIKNQEDEVVARIEFDVLNNEIQIYDAENNGFFENYEDPSNPTHAELIRRDVEKSVIAEAFDKSGNSYLIALIPIINARD